MNASYVKEGGGQITHARLSYCVERVSAIARLVLLSLRLRLRDAQTARMTTRALGQYAGVSASTVHTALCELVAYGYIQRDENHRCITIVPLPNLEHDTDVQGNASKTHCWQMPHARMTESTEKLSKSARLTLISLRLRIKDEQTVSLTLRELAPCVGLCCASIAKALPELQEAGFIRWNKHVSAITVLPLPEVVRSRTELDAIVADLEDALADHEDARDDRQDSCGDHVSVALADHEDSRGNHVSLELHARECGAPLPHGACTLRADGVNDECVRSLSEPASSYDHVQQQKERLSLSQQPREPEGTDAIALRLALSSAFAQSLHTNPYNDPIAVKHALEGRPDGTVAEFEEDLANAKARPNVYSPLGLVLSCWAKGKRVGSPLLARSDSVRPVQHARRQSKVDKPGYHPERPIDPAALRNMGFVGDEDGRAADDRTPICADDRFPGAGSAEASSASWQHVMGERDTDDALLDQARRIAPDADAEELEMLAGELALGESIQTALERLHTQRLRRHYLPTLEHIVAQRPAHKAEDCTKRVMT